MYFSRILIKILKVGQQYQIPASIMGNYWVSGKKGRFPNVRWWPKLAVCDYCGAVSGTVVLWNCGAVAQ